MGKTFSTEHVAAAQSITVGELLDSHLGASTKTNLVWRIEDVALDQLVGTYDPRPYYQAEREYMVGLEQAIDRGDVPPPALIRCRTGYDHADGAHRTIIAIVRRQRTIQAYVAQCTIHRGAE